MTQVATPPAGTPARPRNRWPLPPGQLVVATAAVGLAGATAAIGAYQRGAVALDRYRGRAGTPRPVQEADHERLASAGSLPVEALA